MAQVYDNNSNVANQMMDKLVQQDLTNLKRLSNPEALGKILPKGMSQNLGGSSAGVSLADGYFR